MASIESTPAHDHCFFSSPDMGVHTTRFQPGAQVWAQQDMIKSHSGIAVIGFIQGSAHEK